MGLVSDNTYVFMDDFSSETIRPVVEWILRENLVPKKDRSRQLTLFIESDGGEMSSLWCLVDIMRGSAIPVNTVGIGTIASAGFMAFIAGKHRTLTPNTSILSHQFTEEIAGKQHDLLSLQGEMERTSDRMQRHYKRCLNLSAKKIKDILLAPTDKWLSADEALELGICDEIKNI